LVQNLITCFGTAPPTPVQSEVIFSEAISCLNFTAIWQKK
jgi:hypothetical protein